MRIPLFQNCTDLIGILLGDKDIKTSLDFEERRIQGTLRPVVRVEMKFARGEDRTLGVKSKILRKGTRTKSCRNQGSGDPLTASLEKVASAKIDRWLPLLRPTQINSPWNSPLRSKSNSGICDRQDWEDANSSGRRVSSA